MPRRLNLINQVFGLFKVIEDTGESDKNNSAIWKGECKCGEITYKTTANLTHDNCKSCGCLRKSIMKEKGPERARKYIKETMVNGVHVPSLNRDKANKNSKSGVKGVSWSKSRNKWIAQIYHQGKPFYLGRYTDIDDAIAARKEAEEEIKRNILIKDTPDV